VVKPFEQTQTYYTPNLGTHSAATLFEESGGLKSTSRLRLSAELVVAPHIPPCWRSLTPANKQ